MLKPDLNRYYRSKDLSDLLVAYAAEYPNLIRLEKIGESFEGRELWAVKVTNYEMGSDYEKPAVYIDANIHALEVCTTNVCLWFIQYLITHFGKEENVTRALNTRAFYLIPRICPDGAELALADDPQIVRSSTRPYPYDEEPLGGGLLDEDLDGDGRILFMRYPDPNGSWKEHPDYPGLMIKREPTEVGGKYYRVLPEGKIDGYDGDTISVRSLHAQVTWPKSTWPKEGLDLNRTLPVNWVPESEQLGAGPYPCSEPEIKSVVDFIIQHSNIFATFSLHSFGAIILRPMDGIPDDDMIPEDLRVLENMCSVASDMTHYPAMGSYPNFATKPNMVYSGSMDSWLYDHLGKLAWTIEFWNPLRAIGKNSYHIKYFEWFQKHAVEDDIALYQWAKKTFGNDGYVDWYPYDHPQLGKVELGGWDWMHTWANIPESELEPEISPFMGLFVWTALISPLLHERKLYVEPLGESTYHIRFVVENVGYMPTYVMKKALERNIRGVICELSLPEDAILIQGKLRQDIGQLEGFAYKDMFLNPKQESTTEIACVNWVVYAPTGGEVQVSAQHERAGVVKTSAILH